MPTFKAQPLRDLEALASYVIHLAVRGWVEYDVINIALAQILVKDAKESDDAIKLKAEIDTKANLYLSFWKINEPITPLPYPYKEGDEAELQASVARGYGLFIGKGICITCHNDFGRQAQYMYDKWGTLVRPNNLTQGVYRGGRRPIDIYFRIHAGIDPSTMPGAEATVKSDAKAMWDLVNFVRMMPYPAMLPDEVRLKVYGNSGK